MTSIEQRLTNLFAKTSTRELVKSLRTLDATPASPGRNWARGKTIEELERRFPEAGKAVEAAYDAAEEAIVAGTGSGDVDYVAVLLAAIPADAR